MDRLAVLSVHGCPVSRLGERDTGGMNVYVLQTAKELGLLGVHVDVYTRCHDPNDPEVVHIGKNARVIHLQAGPYLQDKESNLLLQVHDEIIFEVPLQELDVLKSMVVEIMTSSMDLIVPLNVDLKVGYTWGDME